MAFTSLNIQNFRGIKSLEMSDFGQVNVLVGKNNSGKTSVLEAICLVQMPTFLEISNAVLRGQRNEGDSYLLFHNALFHQKPTISAQFSSEVYKQLEFSVFDEGDLFDDDIIRSIGESKIEDLSRMEDKEFIHCVIRISTKSEEFNARIKTKEDLILNLADRYVYSRQFEKLASNILTARRYDATIKKKLNPLIIEKSIHEIIEVLTQIDEKIVGIQLGLNDAVLFDIGLSRLVPMHVMGDGMRQILSILATIATSKEQMVFIDEIDNGLHYSTLAVLWQAILKAAKEFNVQVFATTHSYECLAALAQVQEGNLFGEDVVRVFRLEREGEEHRAVKMTGEDLSVMIGNNWEVR